MELWLRLLLSDPETELKILPEPVQLLLSLLLNLLRVLSLLTEAPFTAVLIIMKQSF